MFDFVKALPESPGGVIFILVVFALGVTTGVFLTWKKP